MQALNRESSPVEKFSEIFLYAANFAVCRSAKDRCSKKSSSNDGNLPSRRLDAVGGVALTRSFAPSMIKQSGSRSIVRRMGVRVSRATFEFSMVCWKRSTSIPRAATSPSPSLVRSMRNASRERSHRKGVTAISKKASDQRNHLAFLRRWSELKAGPVPCRAPAIYTSSAPLAPPVPAHASDPWRCRFRRRGRIRRRPRTASRHCA